MSVEIRMDSAELPPEVDLDGVFDEATGVEYIGELLEEERRQARLECLRRIHERLYLSPSTSDQELFDSLYHQGFIEWESGYKLTARGLGELAVEALSNPFQDLKDTEGTP
jgi:hypothetical protein